MAKYRLGPKDILEKKLSRENPRLNYNRLYAEQLHLLPPEG